MHILMAVMTPPGILPCLMLPSWDTAAREPLRDLLMPLQRKEGTGVGSTPLYYILFSIEWCGVERALCLLKCNTLNPPE